MTGMSEWARVFFGCDFDFVEKSSIEIRDLDYQSMRCARKHYQLRFGAGNCSQLMHCFGSYQNVIGRLYAVVEAETASPEHL
jgi:hypothetical protein